MNSVRNNFLICSNTNTVKVFNNFLCLDCKSKNSNNTSLCQKKKKEKEKERLILNILYTLQFYEKWQDHISIYIYLCD